MEAKASDPDLDSSPSVTEAEDTTGDAEAQVVSSSLLFFSLTQETAN
jgi:hypothetical protein